jgi:hypothetical protein
MPRLEFTAADRDERGRLRPPGFAATLADTMQAVGAAPAPDDTPTIPPRLGRFELAGVVSGLVLAVALIALVNHLTPAQEPPRAPVRPTVAQAPPTAAAPAVAPPVQPTATIAPPTATPEPPTPEVVYVEVAPACDPANPPYVVEQDVYDGSRPIGHVTGTSCDSQADARANADALATQMKARTP